MKRYRYSVDYVVYSKQGFCGNGSFRFSLEDELTDEDIQPLRNQLLAGAIADWEDSPSNSMMRECPIRSLSILNIFKYVVPPES